MSNAMEAAGNQELRAQLLELLKAAGPDGANRRVIGLALGKAGYHVTDGALTEALHYLTARGYVMAAEYRSRAIKLDMTIYVLTPDGIDILEGTKDDAGIGV